MTGTNKYLDNRFFKPIVEDSWASWRYTKESGPLLGAILCTFVPLGYLADVYASDKTYDTWILRITATLFAAGLFFTRDVKSKNEPFFVVWLLITLYVMLLSWTGMFVYNAAYVTKDGNEPDYLFWILQYLVSLYMYSQICASWRNALIIWILATGSVFVGLTFFEDPNWDVIKKTMVYPAPFYLIFALLCAQYNTNRAGIRLESLLAVRSIGSNIAHELRTPLMGISARAKGISKYMDVLLEGYKKAVDAKLMDVTVPSSQTNEMVENFSEINEDSRKASTMIDMVLMSFIDNPMANSTIERLSASDLVNEAISEYPYRDFREKLKVVTLIDRDFNLEVNASVMKHVILALMNNALNQVGTVVNGRVEIRVEGEARRISVTDNGPGVPERFKTEIFEPFFSLTPTKSSSGNGLNFCKKGIEAAGGNLSYQRIDGLTVFSIDLESTALSVDEFSRN